MIKAEPWHVTCKTIPIWKGPPPQSSPDREDSPLQYTIIPVEDRVYSSSYQWYGPIPKGEVLKWSNLKQNKGWQ